jgi:DnaJ-class molecular chaperone
MGNSPHPPKKPFPAPPAPAPHGVGSPSPPTGIPAIAPFQISVPRTAPAVLEERLSELQAMDYFQILKLEKSASPSDIKAAFYRESRAYHPDRFYHMPDDPLKERVHGLYKRIIEAYFVLRDERKRQQYTADISSPQRLQKLRFTEASEVETKEAVKKEHQLQIGSHPKGRQFFTTGMADYNAGSWSNAERNCKMALTYEPQNALYKEKLKDVQQKLYERSKEQGQAFKIK